MTRRTVIDPAQAAERITELSAQVAYHNQRYHQLDDPEISDADFDLLVVPGMGHSNGGQYGTRRMNDFFVRHLQGKDPPNRNGGE